MEFSLIGLKCIFSIVEFNITDIPYIPKPPTPNYGQFHNVFKGFPYRSLVVVKAGCDCEILQSTFTMK